MRQSKEILWRKANLVGAITIQRLFVPGRGVLHQFGPAGLVDGAVHAATAQQRCIRRVHDRIAAPARNISVNAESLGNQAKFRDI